MQVHTILDFLGLERRLYPAWSNLGSIHSHMERDNHYENFPPRARNLLNHLLAASVDDLEQDLGRTFERWQINRDDWR